MVIWADKAKIAVAFWASNGVLTTNPVAITRLPKTPKHGMCARLDGGS